MNMLAMETRNPEAVNTVYNTAYGENTTLNQLVGYLKEFLSAYDSKIAGVAVEYGPVRKGDIPHSLASIDKARKLLGYAPEYDMKRWIEKSRRMVLGKFKVKELCKKQDRSNRFRICRFAFGSFVRDKICRCRIRM